MAINTLSQTIRNFFFAILLVFAYLTIPIHGAAQSVYEQIGRLPVAAYAPEEYMGYPYVISAIQSEEGLMYFGTTLGIHEYDGVSWRSLSDRNEPSAISNFAKDAKGRIFYAGLDFGYLDRDQKGKTKLVSLLHLIPEELQANISINSIHFLNEFILLQTAKHTHRLELTENYTLKSYRSWAAETRFEKGLVLEKQYFVRQQDKGLFRLEGDELKGVEGTELFGKESLAVLLPFPGEVNNTMLLGGQITGFYLFDGSSLSKFPTEVDQLIREGGVLRAGIQHQGNFILGFVGGGVVIINTKGEIIQRINTDTGLPSDGVNGLLLDQAGGLWVMTEDGIARVGIDSPILSFGKESGINSSVLSIQKIDDTIYLGTSSGLVKFDPYNRSFQSLPENNTGLVSDLVKDGEDLIVPGQRLLVIRGNKTIALDGPDDGSRPISALIPKQHPNLMLVNSNGGLLVYQRGLSKEFPWEYQGKVSGVGNNLRMKIHEGKDGTLFTLEAGKIYSLNVQKGELASDEKTRITANTFEFDPVKDFFSIVNGEFFLGNREKIQKYSSEEGKFVIAEDFSEIQLDLFDFTQWNTGILWYESQDQKKYILKRNSEGKFVKDEKLNSLTPYLSPVDFIGEDSIMWFGSPKGLIRYDPKKDNQTDKEFFTLIRRIETKTDTIPLPFYGRKKDTPAVERKDNSYRFEFAAPYFENEKKTKYQTYLEGFDPDWVDWNDNHFKEYTNLSPGSYTFHVRAMSFTGRISEEAVYSFVVLAPWYATWWAYLIYALLIGAAITGIVKWRSRKLKAENRLLEERVAERTTELEKSIADLKATQAQLIQSEKMASLGELTAGIAHEIQNPLNFVNNFSELNGELLIELKEELAKGNASEVEAIANDLIDNESKINHHGKRAEVIVKGMLAHSRTGSGEKELTNLNTLANEYLNLAFQSFKNKNKDFPGTTQTDFDPALPKIEIVRQDIGRVLLNLINNALYACAEQKSQLSQSSELWKSYKPLVSITTKNLGDKIEISVKDNGPGIPPEIKDKIFQPFFTTKPSGQGTGLGLSLSYDIVKAHGGEIKVDSKVGHGTEFIIQLPLLK